MVAVPWMVLGVATTAAWVSALTSWLFEQEQLQEAIDDSRMFTSGGDAKSFSRGEHHYHILVKHGLVGDELIERLDELFDEIDKDHVGRVSYLDVDSMSGPLL